MSELSMDAPSNVPGQQPLLSCLRLQFHQDFTLDDAEALVEYFAGLGVTHLYASPLWAARSGSTHGYDGVDPTRLNPEIGDEAALTRLVGKLRSFGMGLIVDFVPNHLAVGGRENPYWQDVLRWGPSGRFADMFDINWRDNGDPTLEGRLLVPFLGEPYGQALVSGDMTLALDETTGLFHVDYFEHCFPIDPRCHALMLLENGMGEQARLFEQIEDAVSLEEGAERAGLALAEHVRTDEGRAALNTLLERYNPEEPEGAERLHVLLERQHYRLAWWRTANDSLNWRRFFDITELGALRVDDPAVFAQTHVYLLELIERGLVDGVRLDHVDGLADPAGYCRLLRARVDEAATRRPGGAPETPMPIFVEKILEGNESLPLDWGVTGTTGYEFMNAVSKLQHDPAGEAPLKALWQSLSGREDSFEKEVTRARREIADTALVTEFERAVRALCDVARHDPMTRDTTPEMIRRVLRALAVQFPIYRTYADDQGLAPRDENFFAHAVVAARAELTPPDQAVLDQVYDWLGGDAPANDDDLGCRLRRNAIIRFAQLTSPLAAKAVEDTAGYRSAVLISRNDVGFDGAHFAASSEDFHRFNAWQARHFPGTLVTTASHDHKRGEDVRARLAALSEWGDRWAEQVREWLTTSSSLRQPAREDGTLAGPSTAEEMILYQIILGAWPLTLSPDDTQGLEQFANRIADWQEKALREAKLNTHWLYTDEEYETQCRDFVMTLLTDSRGAALRQSIYNVVTTVSPAGALNGLVQTLLRMTVPGVPDCYQGTERWDLSLVDPDNRRPVDFDERRAQLADDLPLTELIEHWRDGRIKQALITQVLGLRQRLPAAFLQGDYQALDFEGERAGQLIGFTREHEGQAVMVIAVRHAGSLLDGDTLQIAPGRWGNTRVKGSKDDARGWQSLTTGQAVDPQAPVAELMASLPFCVLFRDVSTATADEHQALEADMTQAGASPGDRMPSV
ncbi:malto-oligosyltrehalose synthase [Kushneria indalinina]|uniref:Maltooligosyl trehalose synthase n=1 Tax=Kushneria indalinina DSM 14324 TaxID=1122140 RepID=A0A3D9DTY3_9GAMM|nr:malto-oligosyltrehalose synthase [Kushneria indalinina]REC94216.1 maltooligosyl trehalose synthase [Kushneria indalinina DSM 14324]